MIGTSPRTTEQAGAAGSEPHLPPEPPPVETQVIDVDDTLGLEESPVRRAVAVAVVSTGAALVAGGLFTGAFTPRFVAVLATLLGTALAYVLRRTKSPLVVAIATVGGIVAIGVLSLVIVGGFGNLTKVGDLVSKALTQSDLLRPPISMTAGFGALVGWLMAGVGFGAAWTSIVVQRPAVALLVPLPVAGICAISTPQDAQIASGIVLLVAFAIGFFMLSTDRSVTGTDAVPFRYEVRRAVRAIPLIAVISIALVILAQSDLLFPKPIIDPQQDAQKPHAIPISKTANRVLFTVKAKVTGPWVMGVLDVYDGKDWRLPPFDEARLIEIPRSGIVDRAFRPGLKAEITVRGLGGAVLPTLPNTVGVVARGPKLNYDARSGNIRLVEGEINKGFTYALAGAGIPTVDDLKAAPNPPDELIRRFTQATQPPPAAKELIDKAPKGSQWEQWNYLRQWVLANVTASGTGTPVEIGADRIEEILSSTKEASPFEIVAIQTLFARWVGIPSRIGYGFDGGTKAGAIYEYRPKDGAVFPQVYFSGLGWVPVIGIPEKTKVKDTSDPNTQQFHPGVLPSNDIAVTIFRPVERSLGSRLLDRIRPIALGVIAFLLLLALIWISIPPIKKTIRRSRRRAAAIEGGPLARIAEAYAEWRDLLTDFGYSHETDTPLMLLRRFPPDDEHNQLAWLVTRAMWGDLHADVTDTLADDAEELSASLRRRVREAHPITVRGVAVLSRLSMRHPYAIEVPPLHRREELLDVAS